jgi:hypothetical protein
MSQRWTPSDRQAAVAAITENWTPDVAITLTTYRANQLPECSCCSQSGYSMLLPVPISLWVCAICF